MHRIEFEVGQQYENRKGQYEVLAINGDVMHIRWKTREEVITTVTMQGRILENMRRELECPSNAIVPSQRAKKPPPARRRRILRP